MNRTALACIALAASSLVGSVALLNAGPLNPPAGPVAPTYKTLSDVEPRTAVSSTTLPGDADSVIKIFQPGSYYLTGNVSGAASKHGIEISASNVTLDLGGFAVQGFLGSLNGVFVSSSSTNITIRNGSFQLWGGEAISAPTASNLRVENISVTGCASAVHAGDRATISGCLARTTSTHAFIGGNDCRINDCTASQSTSGRGFSFSSGCTFYRCAAVDNSGVGFFAVDDAVFESCSASSNGAVGITCGAFCILRGCTASRNRGSGIFVASQSSVENCNAAFNTNTGVATGGNCTFSGVVASGNGSGGLSAPLSTVTGCECSNNGSFGISAPEGTAIACRAIANDGDGISAAGGLVRGCLTSGNSRDGIRTDANGMVQDCRSHDNDSSGISVQDTPGAGARIEGNAVSSNPFGIAVHASGSFLARNTFKGNLNALNVTPDTVFGTLINLGPGPFNNSNSWANIIH